VKKWQLWLWLPLAVSASTAFASSQPHELASLHVQLAFEYAKVGQYSMALESAERAVAIDQFFSPAWLARAHVEAALTHDVSAERDFRQALVLAPGNAEANNNFGQFLCERGRGPEAMGFLARALADPMYATPQTAYFNLGRCSRLQHQLTQAKHYLLTALQSASDYVPALKELTALYLEQGSVKLASFYYGRLIQYAESLGPEDLLLGIRVARMSGDRVREARYAAQLQSRYPDSKETQQLLSGT
jgi:type IV pilus assembly protein PilF